MIISKFPKPRMKACRVCQHRQWQPTVLLTFYMFSAANFCCENIHKDIFGSVCVCAPVFVCVCQDVYSKPLCDGLFAMDMSAWVYTVCVCLDIEQPATKQEKKPTPFWTNCICAHVPTWRLTHVQSRCMNEHTQTCGCNVFYSKAAALADRCLLTRAHTLHQVRSVTLGHFRSD